MSRAFLPPAFIGVGERSEMDRRPILQQLVSMIGQIRCLKSNKYQQSAFSASAGESFG
ncbi:hypothetical protein HAX54_041574, partial [Datura stramonium]|nr:hypothetical protein [Datura stramonium]